MRHLYTIRELCQPQNGMTMSRSARMSTAHPVTYYALGAGTDISAESYDTDTLYIGNSGTGELYTGAAEEQNSAVSNRRMPMRSGDAVIIPGGTACGKRTNNAEGFVYTEVMLGSGEPGKGAEMNEVIKPGEIFALKDLVPYQEDGIANLDVVNSQDMKFAVLAFDKGTALPEHRAPGDAIVFALEGKAIIGYEGKQYPIEAGQNFRFARNGLHSVTAADGRFKMALLLVRK